MNLPNTLLGAWEDLPALARALGLEQGAYLWQVEDPERPSFVTDEADPGGRWHNSFILVAESLAEARRLLPSLANAGKAHSVHVVLPDRPAAEDGPKTVAQLASGLAAVPSAQIPGRRVCSVRAGKWVQVHHAVASVLAGLVEAGTAPLAFRIGVTDAQRVGYAAGDVQAAVLRPEQLEPDDDDIFPVDLLVAPRQLRIRSLRRPAGVLDPAEGLRDHTGWSAALPPVDTTVTSPRGFDPCPGRGNARARIEDAEIVFRDERSGAAIGSQAAGGALDEAVLHRLRPYSYLDVSAVAAEPGIESAAALAGLAVAGVPMLSPGVPVPPLLGPDIASAIEAFVPGDPMLNREAKSIRMRRAALALFAPAARWNHWAAGFGLEVPEPETVTAVIATRRVDKVAGAVAQMNRQTWGPLEIVVVLHGLEPADSWLQELVRSSRLPLTIRRAPADAVLGEVLNRGLQAAEGEYFAKIDDDDWYAPEHIRDLVLARRHSNATLVGSQVEFVYLEDLDITTRRPPEGERFTTHVAGGTMLIASADLRSLGGWRPVHRAVDRCLLQAVDAAGAAIYRSHGQNYVMHRYSANEGHGGHTWAADTETFLHQSLTQWDGFMLPPAFDATPADYSPPGRSSSLKSLFS